MLTIIIPVFNVAQYIRKCLQSILEQGIDDYEVILVNDASTDNSLGICIEWCQEHPEFRVVSHDKNKGLSEARNTGIGMAKGEWIAFVDSDDYLEPMTLRKVMQHTDENIDVIEFPVTTHIHMGKGHTEYLKFPAQDIDFKRWLDERGFNHVYAWNKVYRASLWQQTRYPAGRFFEDIFTTPIILKKARSIRQINEGAYHYQRRRGSISAEPSAQAWKDYVEGYNLLAKMPEAEGNHELYLRGLNGEIMYHRVSGQKTRLMERRHMPMSFAFARGKGLTYRDRLKILWFSITIH